MDLASKYTNLERKNIPFYNNFNSSVFQVFRRKMQQLMLVITSLCHRRNASFNFQIQTCDMGAPQWLQHDLKRAF